MFRVNSRDPGRYRMPHHRSAPPNSSHLQPPPPAPHYSKTLTDPAETQEYPTHPQDPDESPGTPHRPAPPHPNHHGPPPPDPHCSATPTDPDETQEYPTHPQDPGQDPRTPPPSQKPHHKLRSVHRYPVPHPSPEPGNQRENPPCASESKTSWPQRPRHHQRARLFQPGRGRRELAPTPSPRSSIHRGAVGHAPDRRIVAPGLGRRPAARWQPAHRASHRKVLPARRSGSRRPTTVAPRCARELSQRD